MKGFYSILQYVPDTARVEAVNVGVLLSCEKGNFVDIKTLETNTRVTRFFDGASQKVLNLEKSSFEQLVRNSKSKLITLDGLKAFIATRTGCLRLTTPWSVKVDEPVQLLRKLLVDFVGIETKKRKKKVSNARKLLDTVFSELEESRKAKVKPIFRDPITDTDIDFSYSYKNGLTNFVQPKIFNSEQGVRKVISSASSLASTGQILHFYSKGFEGQLRKQLIVVPEIIGENKDQVDSTKNALEKLFETHHVSVAFDVDEFVAKVRTEAHG